MSEALEILREHTLLLEKILKEMCNQRTELSKSKDPSETQEIPTLPSVEQFARTLGAPNFLAEMFFFEKEGLGWRHNGQPIYKWQALFRNFVKAYDRKHEVDSSGGSHTKMDDDTRREMRRAAWVRNNLDKWVESGCPDDITECLSR